MMAFYLTPFVKGLSKVKGAVNMIFVVSLPVVNMMVSDSSEGDIMHSLASVGVLIYLRYRSTLAATLNLDFAF